jgi:hypothetical protein
MADSGDEINSAAASSNTGSVICRSTSEFVDDESIESGDPENLGVAVGTAYLSVAERKK